MAEDFEDDKTEPASARKRAEARSRGQVARSQEVNSVLVLLASILTLTWIGPHMARELGSLSRLYWAEGLHRSWTQTSMQGELVFLLRRLAIALGPLFLLIGAAGVLSNLVQVGVLFSAEPLRPKLSNLSPAQGLKRLFSRNGLVELVKAIVKIALITWITWGTLCSEYVRLTPLLGSGLSQILPAVGGAMFHLAMRVTLALCLVAVADYGWQRMQFERSLKMTKEEVREESKQSEGDPRVRARIRAMQRSLSRHRMMQAVPTADVVITNPTHYAVALHYRNGEMNAPRVVAKGARLLALRIKEIAREHGVPTVEDRQLARALYRSVEIGQEIPMQFFEAVAEVLAFVFRLRARRAGAL